MKKKATAILDPEVDDWCYLLAQVVIHQHQGPPKRAPADDDPNRDSDHEDRDGSPPPRPNN